MMQLLCPTVMAALLLLLLWTETLTATQEEPKWKIETSAKINGPAADKVWPLFANYCDIYKTFPIDITFCVSEASSKPGLIRYTAAKTPSAAAEGSTTIVLWAEEELLAIDQTKRSVTYQVLRNNRGYKRLIATVQILPIDDYSCEHRWSVVADPMDGTTYEAFAALITSMHDQTVEKINNLFGAN